MFNGTNLTLSSDDDQDAYGKVTKTQENTTHKRAKKVGPFPAGDHKAPNPEFSTKVARVSDVQKHLLGVSKSKVYSRILFHLLQKMRLCNFAKFHTLYISLDFT